MFEFIRRLFRRPPIDPTELSEDLWDILRHKCPACNHKSHWYGGPQGGSCVNIFCGHCGQGYNVAPDIGVAQMIHRDVRYIDPPEDP